MGAQRIVVITGATSGVGRACVRRFAERGFDVALIARGADGLEGARRDVEAAGRRALPIGLDVTDAGGMHEEAGRVERELGPIDVWVNNAMTTVFAPIDQMTPDEYRRVTEVTYLGFVWGTMAALARMKPRDRGTIVQVGSALAYRAIPLQSAYCGAKHAIRAFTDSLRAELLHDKSAIRVSMVQLPGINTPQFDRCLSKMPRAAQPVPPIFQPEVAARGVVSAAERPRREIYIGGATLKVVWGEKLIPGLLDHYLARKAFSGQMNSIPADPERPSNLMQPVPGDPGAHGRFDGRSKYASPIGALSAAIGAAGVRSGAVAVVLGGTAALALFAWRRR